jgi:hypothetical protein
MAAGPAEAPRRQCISQISKCKVQNCGMAFGHDFISLGFDFFILRSAYCIHQAPHLGSVRRNLKE